VVGQIRRKDLSITKGEVSRGASYLARDHETGLSEKLSKLLVVPPSWTAERRPRLGRGAWGMAGAAPPARRAGETHKPGTRPLFLEDLQVVRAT